MSGLSSRKRQVSQHDRQRVLVLSGGINFVCLGRIHPRRPECGHPQLASVAGVSAQQGLSWQSRDKPWRPSFDGSCLPVQPPRQSTQDFLFVPPQQPPRVQHAGPALVGVHGGCTHQSSPFPSRNCSCNSRSAPSIASSAWKAARSRHEGGGNALSADGRALRSRLHRSRRLAGRGDSSRRRGRPWQLLNPRSDRAALLRQCSGTSLSLQRPRSALFVQADLQPPRKARISHPGSAVAATGSKMTTTSRH